MKSRLLRHIFVIGLCFPLFASAQLTFEFSYTDTNSGFNDPNLGAARRTALETAAQQLSQLLPVATPVVLTFTVQSNNNNDSTLASAGSDSVGEGVGFSPTIAQQKVVTGNDANGSSPDGSIEWNFFHNWDLDNSVAGDAYDFTSTAMHEILHALGFTSAIDSAGNGLLVGTVGEPNAWYTFDQFVVTASGQSLVNSQYRFNTSLINVLDDDPGLFFNGANAVAANGGALVPLYTPNPWEDGSSGSHTNDQTYAGASALLMNAATDTGPGVRTLSAIELGILRDLGFTFTNSNNPDPDPEPVGVTYLSNISVRTIAGSGNSTLTAGFAISGGSKAMLIRGIGPTLATFQVPGTLPDPRIGLFSGSNEVQNNDNWPASATATFNTVGAFALNPSSLDAALVTTLTPGAYTVQITDTGNATGIALAEIYDTAPPTSASGPRFTNISARAQVGTGNEVLVAGFVIAGTGTKTLLLRGVGPALSNFNIEGALADPQLTLFRSENGSSTQINQNDDWNATTINPVAQRLGAFDLSAGSRDAALLVTLQPGAYTVQLSGVNATSGIGIIEVYDAD